MQEGGAGKIAGPPVPVCERGRTPPPSLTFPLSTNVPRGDSPPIPRHRPCVAVCLSGGYKARVLAQPSGEELKHAEWDGWGFAGADTTVFLVFDPTDSLAEELGAQPPVKARGLPCEVVRVRRLDSQWYAVLFYTETYWGQGDCR